MKKIKFLLSVFMAIVMMAMSPARAWAQSPIQVSTAEEFISAITNNTTASIQLMQDITFETQFNGGDSKNITIDLNNHTLTHTYNSGVSFFYAFEAFQALTIKNGTLSSTYYLILNNGTLNINNCNINATKSCILNDGAGSNSYLNNVNLSSSLEFAISISNGSVNFNGPCCISSESKTPIYNNNQTINIESNYKMVDHEGNEISTFNGYVGEMGKSVSIVAAAHCAVGSHTMEHHEAVSATCTATGTIEYWHCTVCGGDYADEQGNTLLSYSQLIAPALGHDLDANGDCTRCDYSNTLVEGENTGIEFGYDYSYFRFVAPGTGTLTVAASGSGDSYGVLKNADLSTTLTSNDDGNGNSDFKFSYEVTGGETYYVGIRNYYSGTLTNYTITITGTWPVVITDGVAYATKKQYSPTADRVSMARTFTADKPSTVMLPFTVDASQIGGATFHEFKGVAYDSEKGEWIATMQTVSTVEAYKPYVAIPTAASLTFGTNSETVTFPTTASSTGNLTQADGETGWTFVALNANKTWAEDDPELGKAYGFAGKNKDYDDYSVAKGEFVKIAAGASAKPGRCYLVKNDGEPLAAKGMTRASAADELPSTIKVRFINSDSDVNGIAELNTETGEMSDVKWYDLNGRRIEKPTKGGIYIKNNKKVMVK